MRIQFLGTAAAEGVPAPFCECDMCTYARKIGGKEIRKRCSILVNDDLIIDLGPDILWNSLVYNLNYRLIKYIVISHSHFDHMCLISFMMALPKYRRQTLPQITILGSEDSYRALIKRLECFEEEAFWATFSFQVIKQGDSIEIGEYIISAFGSNHDEKEQCLLYAIVSDNSQIFYGTDSRPYKIEQILSEKDKYLFDVIISDCTYGGHKNVSGRHMGLYDNAIIFSSMRQLGVLKKSARYILTHFSHDSLDTFRELRDMAKENGMEIAYDGMEIEIKKED